MCCHLSSNTVETQMKMGGPCKRNKHLMQLIKTNKYGKIQTIYIIQFSDNLCPYISKDISGCCMLEKCNRTAVY